MSNGRGFSTATDVGVGVSTCSWGSAAVELGASVAWPPSTMGLGEVSMMRPSVDEDSAADDSAAEESGAEVTAAEDSAALVIADSAAEVSAAEVASALVAAVSAADERATEAVVSARADVASAVAPALRPSAADVELSAASGVLLAKAIPSVLCKALSLTIAAAELSATDETKVCSVEGGADATGGALALIEPIWKG